MVYSDNILGWVTLLQSLWYIDCCWLLNGTLVLSPRGRTFVWFFHKRMSLCQFFPSQNKTKKQKERKCVRNCEKHTGLLTLYGTRAVSSNTSVSCCLILLTCVNVYQHVCPCFLLKVLLHHLAAMCYRSTIILICAMWMFYLKVLFCNVDKVIF